MPLEGQLRLTELEIVQNPAFGAYLLWQFGLGYQAESEDFAMMPFFFVVLPILLHKPTLSIVSSTRKSSGLSLFVSKLSERREDLLAIHSRAQSLRPLTLQSIGIAVNSGLMAVQYEDATLRSINLQPKEKKPNLPERLKPFSGAADKLGHWCCRSGPSEVFSALGIVV